ncbi:B-cell receptor CD22-like [Pygocentrus nattereri]|uniref:B-cell receptor CD22-like n=1 Tax=Pygocentrus nattereri TaxID=42514 RepID=UPI001891C4A2|nr:B-cell receptor CD22-like [Pygocentrus nattereri]
MRSLRMAPPFPLVFLLMTAGAFGTKWSVKYNQQKICALKGSTVFMNGTFTHPEGIKVTETFWSIDPVKGVEPTDLSKDPVYSGRVEFLTDDQKHFSLKLSDVMKKDEHQFCFRIITNEEKERWTSVPGVRLRVTELHVEAPEEVMEGETADLTCKTTCSLTDPTFIWYKNGRPLTTKTIKNNQLHLQTVSSEDAGSYSCAVGGSQHLRSTAHSLRVRYPPKRVSVSISSSGEIVEGSSVTLTCSSDGNPPVKIYTWFKEGGTSPVGSGQNYSIISITADHTELYYCEAQNEHGAQRSAGVSVPVEGQGLSAVWIAVGGGGGFVLISVLICIWRMNKRATRTDHNKPKQDDVLYTTYRPGQTTADTDADSATGVADDVHYATVRIQNDKVTSTDQQGEPQYASVTFQHYTAATGSLTQTVDEPSVIYSTATH